MNKELKKEIIERIKSIISVLVFLGAATWYWYGPREDITYLATNMNKYYIKNNVKMEIDKNIKLDNKGYSFKVTNKTKEIQNYEIIVNNNYIKSRTNDCNIIQNNYLKYQLSIENTKLDSRNLNIDGIIYRGLLQPNESIDFLLSIGIDKSGLDKNDCFFPVLNASTYYKV